MAFHFNRETVQLVLEDSMEADEYSGYLDLNMERAVTLLIALHEKSED